LRPDIQSIRTIIGEGRLDELIGLEEDLHFEVKGSQPYDLDKAGDRFELAKDVSALANSEGGIIVVGLLSAPSASTQRDVVDSLDLIPEVAFDISKITGVIRDNVWPEISGLHVFWKAYASDSANGVGAIVIPPQSDNEKPFLISKVSDGDVMLKQIVFGYARRSGADALPLSAREIVALMRQGMTPVPQRLTSIEEKLASALEELAKMQSAADSRGSHREAAELLDRRISALINK
jgi:predicted HTH transcriptional regulator